MTGIKRRLGSLLGPQGKPGKDGEDGKDGDRGLPGPDAIPADEAISTFIRDDSTKAHQALNAHIRHEIALPPLPLANVNRSPRSGRPVPITEFDGYVWGGNGSTIHRSADNGGTWESITTIPSDYGTGTQNISALLPCDDGEVLVFTHTHVGRSEGWGTENVTWNTVLENPTASHFYPWGIDGDGQKFIVVHYAGSGTMSPDRADSQYGWISIDGGHTFQLKWDTAELFSSDFNARTHIHAAAYDPWEDRFFIAEGHEEHTGVYVSYNDGDTWELVPYEGISPRNAPTTITPTDHGIVFGTDGQPNGVYVLPRGSVAIRISWVWSGVWHSQLNGYAHMGYRDKRTGLVYLVYELNPIAEQNGVTTFIVASDGRVAGPVLKNDPSERLWRRVVVSDDGTLIAYDQATDTHLTATTSGVGVLDPLMHDTGNTLGAETDGQGSVGVGSQAVAKGIRAVAVGNASVSGNGGISIGGNAYAEGSGISIGERTESNNLAIAIGVDAAASNGMAIGARSTASHAQSTSLGRSSTTVTPSGNPSPRSTAVGMSATASASGGDATTVGFEAEAEGNRGTALGAQAEAQSNYTTAVGYEASANSGFATAVGYQAVATHGEAVALGSNSETTESRQLNIGRRHIEMGNMSISPTPPPEGSARLYFNVLANGTQRIVAQFPNGETVIIAQTS